MRKILFLLALPMTAGIYGCVRRHPQVATKTWYWPAQPALPLKRRQFDEEDYVVFLAAGFICSAVFAQDVGALRTEIYSKLRDKRCNMPLSECNCPEAIKR